MLRKLIWGTGLVLILILAIQSVRSLRAVKAWMQRDGSTEEPANPAAMDGAPANSHPGMSTSEPASITPSNNNTYNDEAREEVEPAPQEQDERYADPPPRSAYPSSGPGSPSQNEERTTTTPKPQKQEPQELEAIPQEMEVD